VSDTPRTDAAEYRQPDTDPAAPLGMVDVDFTRQLERELNTANEKVKRLVKVGDEMERWMRNPRNLGGDPFMADQWQDAKEATR
jgi:hypothetical protein